ncbi:hypothetical protein GOP47_0026881 [Adiantum capillus-veneris]|nr:hypothetical protein GOP47_0026881 [Adiantum capillus-veneris]
MQLFLVIHHLLQSILNTVKFSCFKGGFKNPDHVLLSTRCRSYWTEPCDHGRVLLLSSAMMPETPLQEGGYHVLLVKVHFEDSVLGKMEASWPAVVNARCL